MKRIVFLFAVSIGWSSCNDEISPEKRLEQDIEIIEQFITDNDIENVQVDPSGLRYVIHQEGTGVAPSVTNLVSVGYEGRFLSSGVIFDQNESISFSLSSVIEGWQIGIPLIQEGGSITLYIPSGLAYGTSGRGPIPPNAILIFDVNLIQVE